jgi:phosphoribosylaminoimidazolecarboxamide formyltransferase / IMP cyclohydrolase
VREIRRALISVSDKTGLVPFAKALSARGIDIVSTSGTADALREAGIDVTLVEDLTGAAEMLGGRVKTLHPAVHGGILARRHDEGDMASLQDRGIEPIDLVVVNLYPFQRLAARRDADEAELLESIDIGGPALLRAAAKNFRDVTVVCDPERYGFLLSELDDNGGALSVPTRRELAADAFAHTAGYDLAIANWFTDAVDFPERLFVELVRHTELPYGENPHQRAAYYAERGARRHVLSMVHQHAGKGVTFNNIADISAGRDIAREFTLPTCVIIKHTNPCGVAMGARIEEAYASALACDPDSAFGGVVVLNRPVSQALAQSLADQFVEVLFAPGYEDGAVEVLARRPNVRILESRERRRANPGERDHRRVLGGMLVQDYDSESEDRDMMTVVTQRTPSEREWGDLTFAWRVAKHVGSNAIVIARDLATIGIGAGQMSRVDAVRIALAKARGPVEGAALASDAFFPFPDGPALALEAGVRAFIQPGGAKRDDEVTVAVDGATATMVFTGRRHFRH